MHASKRQREQADITPGPGGHRPQLPCANGGTCTKQEQAQGADTKPNHRRSNRKWTDDQAESHWCLHCIDTCIPLLFGLLHRLVSLVGVGTPHLCSYLYGRSCNSTGSVPEYLIASLYKRDRTSIHMYRDEYGRVTPTAIEWGFLKTCSFVTCSSFAPG